MTKYTYDKDEKYKKNAEEILNDFVLQTAKLEVLKIVRDNIMATEQYWKFRKNVMTAGGILVESNVEVIDMGDIIELRVVCKIPPESAENYAKRRLLFKKLCKMIEERGKEYIKEVFATNEGSGLMKKSLWGADEEVS